MLADPQTITINSIANGLAAVSRLPLKSVYASADGKLELTIGHERVSSGRRERHLMKLTQVKDVVDPYSAPAKTGPQTLTAYLLIDQPIFGWTDAEIEQFVYGLRTWQTTATMLKVLGNES